MSTGLLLFVALIYAVIGWEYAQDGRTGMAIAWVAYAAANVGFALDAR